MSHLTRLQGGTLTSQQGAVGTTGRLHMLVSEIEYITLKQTTQIWPTVL